MGEVGRVGVVVVIAVVLAAIVYAVRCVTSVEEIYLFEPPERGEKPVDRQAGGWDVST